MPMEPIFSEPASKPPAVKLELTPSEAEEERKFTAGGPQSDFKYVLNEKGEFVQDDFSKFVQSQIA